MQKWKRLSRWCSCVVNHNQANNKLQLTQQQLTTSSGLCPRPRPDAFIAVRLPETIDSRTLVLVRIRQAPLHN